MFPKGLRQVSVICASTLIATVIGMVSAQPGYAHQQNWSCTSAGCTTPDPNWSNLHPETGTHDSNSQAPRGLQTCDSDPPEIRVSPPNAYVQLVAPYTFATHQAIAWRPDLWHWDPSSASTDSSGWKDYFSLPGVSEVQPDWKVDRVGTADFHTGWLEDDIRLQLGGYYYQAYEILWSDTSTATTWVEWDQTLQQQYYNINGIIGGYHGTDYCWEPGGAIGSAPSVKPPTVSSGSTGSPPQSSTLANPFSATANQQYHLSNSDGATWQDIDSSRLSMIITPTSDAQAMVTGNADLWTASAGFNQDLGISVSGGTAPAFAYPSAAGQPEGWKESGGFAGTYSPNAAFVQTIVPLSANVPYTFRLQWKTNIPAGGATIYAGAGSAGGYSPTRLSVTLLASSPLILSGRSSARQYSLSGSDGSTWQDIDPENLAVTITPDAASEGVISGNADLWTANAGYNQDIGIFISGGAYGAGTLVAWKESGGFAGTFSPNAAYVKAHAPLSQGVTYSVRLRWKANLSSSGAMIFAGAGPINGRASPTSLAVQLAASSGFTQEAVTNQQYHLSNSNGTSWQDIDATNLSLGVTAGLTCRWRISAGVDLWTSNAGYNQDVGLFVNGVLVAWKESGGFAGTFSPNAAFVETTIDATKDSTYTISLKWKANRYANGATLYAAAGPSGGSYSPTSINLEVVQCR